MFRDEQFMARIHAEANEGLGTEKPILEKEIGKVLVHDRRTMEVWSGLPNPQRFEDWNKWLPRQDSNL